MFYNILLNILLFISKFTKKSNFVEKRLKQNFDFDSGKYCWVHCSSVGEINLSEGLIEEFLDKTGFTILVSVMTDTGYETAYKKYSKNSRIKLIYFPLDKVNLIKNITNQIDLKKLILVETEIWPNLINIVSRNSEIYIVNGRISDKSFSSYKKFKFLLKKSLDKIDVFIMQTEEDVKRIQILGADENKVHNYGNMKFDIKLPDFSHNELEELKVKHKIGNRKIFTAGSTREGEDKYILEVYDKLQNYFLYLVPRHLERCEDIEESLLKNKYNYARLSDLDVKKDKNLEDLQIILVDKMGILRKLYAVCDVAFVGATMVNIGGHSLLEPLYYRKFPIFGQYIQNVSEIGKEIVKRNIGLQVYDTKEFRNAVLEIEKGRLEKGEIQKFFSENSNAVRKTFNEIMKK